MQNSYLTNLNTVRFENLKKLSSWEEVFTWENEPFKADNEWYNGPNENGVIISPFMTAKVNGQEIPVYCSRAAFSAHSYSFVIVDDDKINLDVELYLFIRHNDVDVLPEYKNIKAKIAGERVVTSNIDKLGSFSFVFDGDVHQAFTLIVRKKKKYEVPKGYTVYEIPAGEHQREETYFNKEKTVYRFLSGSHSIEQIILPSNSILELGEGAIIHVKNQDGASGIFTDATENVTVRGLGMIDFSSQQSGVGGVAIDMRNVKNISYSDITIVNSHSWSLCFTACENVEVNAIAIFGHRIWSDGVMLSDCVNGHVYDCFIRTGDDAAEVKSTSNSQLRTDNILFEDIAAWTDKAAAYGVIFEANHDTQNVTFRNCSVGFSLPNWSDHLGCYTVYIGDNSKATDYNITFENFEIYSTKCPPISLVAFQGKIRDISFKNGKVKHLYAKRPIYLWVKDKEKASIGRVDFENIVIENVKLTKENQDEIIKISVPDGVSIKDDIFIK